MDRRQHRAPGCSPAPSSGYPTGLLLCTLHLLGGKARAERPARQTLGGKPCYLKCYLSPSSGKNIKQAKGRLLHNGGFSWASSDTNLPYSVTMETRADCQPYSADTCFLLTAALDSGDERVSAESFPKESLPPADQAHRRAEPLSHSTQGKDTPSYLLLAVTAPGKAGYLQPLSLPQSHP